MFFKIHFDIIIFTLMYFFIFIFFKYKDFFVIFDFVNYNELNFFKKLIIYFTDFYYNFGIFIFLTLLVILINSSDNFDFKLESILIFLICMNRLVPFDFFLDNNIIKWFDNPALINKNLQNGLLIVHPIITYLCYVIFSTKLDFLGDEDDGYYNVIFLNFFIRYDFLFAVISLILGSIWSSQEVGWGGFWNWDPVELILLLYVLFYLFIFHENNFSLKFFFSIYFLNYIPLYTEIFTYIIRFDLFKSIHTFVSSNESMKFNVGFFIFLCFFLYLDCKYSFKFLNLLNMFIFKKRFKHFLNINVYFIIMYLIIFYIAITTFSFQFVDYEINYIYVLFVSILILLLFLTFFKKSFFFNLTFFKKNNFINFFLLIFFCQFFFYKIYLYVSIVFVYKIFFSNMFKIYFHKFFNKNYILLLLHFLMFLLFYFLFFWGNPFVEDLSKYSFNYLNKKFFYITKTGEYFLTNGSIFFKNLFFYKNFNINFFSNSFSSGSYFVTQQTSNLFLNKISYLIFFLNEGVLFFISNSFVIVGIAITVLMLTCFLNIFYLKNTIKMN